MRVRQNVNNARTRWWVLLVAVGLALPVSYSSSAHADRTVVPSRIESARGMALGTGVRAAAASTQAQAENPANLLLGGVYHIETLLGYDPTFKRLGYGASVVDSMTSRLAAGLSMRGLYGDNDAGENSGWEGRLGLGVPVGDFLSIGVAGRYSNMTISDTHARPERVPAMDERPDRSFKLKAFTMDTAITVRPVNGLSIAALAYNLIDTESALAPLTVGGSAAFSTHGFTFGGDVLVDLNRHHEFSGPKSSFGGGLEFLAAGMAPLRLGYMFDQGRTQHFITGGLGYVDPRIAAQVSIRQTLSGAGETSLFFALSYFVQ